jgi:putative transcriptional regulator
MPKTNNYKTPALASLHEMMSDLHEAGLVDKATMRRFDESCLTPVEKITPVGILRLRQREGASQAVFARYLNVSKNSISQWERGEKHPTGPALKLLALVAAKGLSAIA